MCSFTVVFDSHSFIVLVFPLMCFKSQYSILEKEKKEEKRLLPGKGQGPGAFCHAAAPGSKACPGTAAQRTLPIWKQVILATALKSNAWRV